MSNLELCKHFMGLTPKTHMPVVSNPSDIIRALDRHFSGQWAWEVTDERIYDSVETRVMTTVAVYVPGRILTGRAFTDIDGYHSNHFTAIFNACQSIMEAQQGNNVGNTTQQSAPVSTPQPEPQQTNQSSSMQMTPEQIMAMANGTPAPAPEQPKQQNNGMINTREEFYNYTENGQPVDAVPFDKISDQCHKELEEELFAGKMNPPVDPNAPAVPQANNNPKGFTPEQIQKVNQFKKDFDIVDDAMFANFVNSWNSNYHSKKDLTPENVDEFLQWANGLGEMGC